MCITYRQLTQEQRYQIQVLLIAAGLNQSQIANQLGCHRNAVNRELSRCPSSSFDAQ